jgi:hypothetical protein
MEIRHFIFIIYLICRYINLGYNYFINQEKYNISDKIKEVLYESFLIVPILIYDIYYYNLDLYFYSIKVIYILISFVFIINIIRQIRSRSKIISKT